MGGHLIPEATIRRRYDRGIANLFDLYLPEVDAWRIFDASAETPREIVRYTHSAGKTVSDLSLWEQIKG
jgi:predicted ABC-type ATPase